MKKELYHVGITVSDLKESVKFYELLGFRRNEPAISLGWEDFFKDKNVFYKLPNGSNATVIYMESLNGMSVELFQFENDAGRARPVWNESGIHHIAVRTDNLKSMRDLLKNAGVQIEVEPVKGKKQAFMFVRDPDGNLIEIAEPYGFSEGAAN